ncbi:MAG: hypothetical protein ACRC4W_04675, partial [Treponemataceae bacterium]
RMIAIDIPSTTASSYTDQTTPVAPKRVEQTQVEQTRVELSPEETARFQEQQPVVVAKQLPYKEENLAMNDEKPQATIAHNPVPQQPPKPIIIEQFLLEEESENDPAEYLFEGGQWQHEQTHGADSHVPSPLKREMKNMLLYMDKLLENLPEDKVREFANSEHFQIYENLFTELGLS